MADPKVDIYDAEAMDKLPRVQATRLYVDGLEEERDHRLNQMNAIHMLLEPDSNYAKDTASIYQWSTNDALRIVADAKLPSVKPMSLQDIQKFIQGDLDVLNEEINDAVRDQRNALLAVVAEIKSHIYSESTNQKILEAIEPLVKHA